MKKLIFCTLLIAFCIIFTTCQKEGNLVCTDKNTTQVVQHAKDFFRFTTGSWWVYEEENSGARDSVWVSNFTEKAENYTKWKKMCNCAYGKCSQEIFMTFENKENNSNTLIKRYYTSILSASSLEPENSYLYFYSDEFYTPDILYENKKPANNYYWNIMELESYTVDGKVFNDVIYAVNTDEWGRNFKHERWYAKNIYLIKYKDTDSTTWNLIDYHIVQ